MAYSTEQQEPFLANVEVDVSPNLVCYVGPEVAADDAMPHALEALFESSFD